MMSHKEETQVQMAIAERAMPLFRKAGVDVTKLEVFMDVANVHKVCPLRLQELLEADDFNFSHDIGGIYSHFNRQTKKLENFFMPRFAA